FTWRTKCVQCRMMPLMIRSIVERAQREAGTRGRRRRTKSLSAFQAFSISAAARVGTGNVSGVAGALFLGGPGAVLWMWIMCMFTAGASFVESTLAQLYKVRAADTYKRGPAIHIYRGRGSRGFGAFFAGRVICGSARASRSPQAHTPIRSRCPGCPSHWGSHWPC